MPNTTASQPLAGTSLALLLALVSSLSAQTPLSPSPAPPPLAREFRGVWVASVYNIDWPSKRGLPVEQQKTELTELIQSAKASHMNAVILQVRPMGDALYPSQTEPWSAYLTGRMGQPPDPPYDPLALAIETAHHEGIELHAWFNPYRAMISDYGPSGATNHITRRHPEWVRQHGKYQWLDPAEPEAQNYILGVINEVVERYDVDGVHIDDYFYPPIQTGTNGQVLDFDDAKLWQPYQEGSGKLDRNNWRRVNVNKLIQRMTKEIHARKPWVKFGISPAGIWKSGCPAGIVGLGSYNGVFGDSRRWLTNGWCDYLAPQLYWRIAPKEQSFPALLTWWLAQNTQARHVWPGLATSNLDKWPAQEIADQIDLTRQFGGKNAGHIHYHYKNLKRGLKAKGSPLPALYADPALIPACPWLGPHAPAKPEVQHTVQNDLLHLTWTAEGGEKPWLWAIQTRTTNGWATTLLPAATRQLDLPKPETVAVTAVSRTGMASPSTVVMP